MYAQSLKALLGLATITANAAPSSLHLSPRQDPLAASLPQNDPNSSARAAAVAYRNTNFVYGPSLIGQAAPFPNGTLGNARTNSDLDLYNPDRANIDARVAQDAAAIQAAIMKNGGLKTLDDYTNVLYNGEWTNANPLGTTPGIMANYTQDLLFSMERLSQNPYPVQLVQPGAALPFDLPDDLTTNITTTTLADLQASGNLFVVDHSYQLAYPKTQLEPKRYGAACTAYFYIHPQSGDFLPLAIKTNVDNDLIYTPLDQPTDWLFAKMLFNVNDMFHAQMFHLVVTHDVSEAVHQAALHTLSEIHPVMIMLERIMYQAYSSRVIGEWMCFNEGGHWDQLFYINNTGTRQYVTEAWPVRGAFQAGYLETDLKTRGMIDDNGAYKFKSFPFFEDASAIKNAYSDFFTSFVNSYYASDTDVAADFELQNWFVEASKNAGVVDFPQVSLPDRPADKQTLIDALTHMGYIVSVVHHALNGGDPVGSKATLPFHLNALYAPVPAAKGVTDLMPFMPPAADAVHYIGFLATFNRPFYAEQNRTLEWAFSNNTMLDQFTPETGNAAAEFLGSMQNLSTQVRGRSFDADGLSEGMPFIYRTLDPNYIPFFCAV